MAENNTTTNDNVYYQYTYNILPVTIMSVLGAVSNVLLLVAFIKDPLKCFRNSGTYLVMNLSVSDCLASLIARFYLEARRRIPKSTSDLIIDLFGSCVGSASFLSITSISIDRFLIVAYPIKHRILMKGKHIILWLASIWILSSLLCVFSLKRFHYRDTNIAFVFAVIIIIMSAVMYLSTYYKLKKQSRNLAAVNSSEVRVQEIRILKEKRFLKTIIIITCVSVGCVVPSMIFNISYGFLDLPKDNLTSEGIRTASVLFVYINFAINPLIYLLRLPNYRKTFCMLFCRRSTTSR